MRVLVTGATGYLGGRLVRLLHARGDEVHALVRDPGSRDLGGLGEIASVHEDRGDFESVRAAVEGCDPHAVYHLAGTASVDAGTRDPAPIIQANVVLAARVLEAAARAGSPRAVVLASSYWEYSSDGAYAPNTLYAATKRAARDLAAWYAGRGLIRGATLVLYDVYGPEDPRPKLIPAMLRAAASGEPLAMTEGNQRVDFVHADDAARAFVAAAEALLALPSVRAVAEWGASSGRRVTIRELHAMLERSIGASVPVEWGRKEYPEGQIFEPAGGIAPPPRWAPTITLERGLAETGAAAMKARREVRV